MLPALARNLLQCVIVAAAMWLALHDDAVARLCAGREMLPAAALLLAGVAGLVWRRVRARGDAKPAVASELHWLTLPFGVALFMVPLAGAWGSMRSHGAFIGGVLPYSDAADYVAGGLRLLADGTLDAWNSRRPLNAVLLAVRLALAGGELRSTLALQALVLAWASWVAARAVARDLGWPAGTLVFGGMLIFGGIFVPTTMSESLGLSLGALALATLWHTARDPAPWRLALGFLTLAAALQARSGPVFVVPALLLWATFSLHDRAATGRRWSPRHLAAALVGVVGGVALNALVMEVHHGVKGGAQANFSYTFYGLAIGGKGWEQAWTDFPQIRAMPESEGAALIYERALAHLRAHPADLAVGFFRNVECLVFSWTEQASGDALAHHAAAQWSVAAALVVLGALTLRRLFRTHPNDAALPLVVAAGFGMLASVPVIYMDGRERVFAAAFPFALAGVAYALSSLARSVAAAPFDAADHADMGTVPAAVSAVMLALAVVGVPVARAVIPAAPADHPVHCARGHGAALWATRVPAMITLVNDPAALAVPREDVAAFRRGIYRDPNLGTNGLTAALAALPAGTQLVLGFDVHTRTLQYYAAPADTWRREGDTIDVCATPATSDARTVQRVEARGP